MDPGAGRRHLRFLRKPLQHPPLARVSERVGWRAPIHGSKARSGAGWRTWGTTTTASSSGPEGPAAFTSPDWKGVFAAVADGLSTTRHRAQASGAITSPSWSDTATPPLRACPPSPPPHRWATRRPSTTQQPVTSPPSSYSHTHRKLGHVGSRCRVGAMRGGVFVFITSNTSLSDQKKKHVDTSSYM